MKNDMKRKGVSAHAAAAPGAAIRTRRSLNVYVRPELSGRGAVQPAAQVLGASA